MICDWWISIRFGCFCVQGLLLVIIIMIDGSKKRNKIVKAAFELQSLRVFEKHSKVHGNNHLS